MSHLAPTSPATPPDSLRVDKYLHYIRIFGTRDIAAAACEKSNVRVGGNTVKPARNVRLGDIIDIERGDLKLVLKVTGFPQRRLGAPLVPQFCDNLTPPENYARAAAASEQRRLTQSTPAEQSLRPSKKDLRDIRRLLGRDGE
jgi:ribosome-associated heat shock protein Hsp15